MIINNVKLLLENEVVHGSLPAGSDGRRRWLAAAGAD